MIVKALRALLEEWMPLAFLCGRKARACVWAGRARGSGVIAKEVVMTCLLGLLNLRGDRAHTVEYVRMSSVALILWTDWHSSIQGACYSDEPNEACLSQLGRWWKHHPEIKTAQQLADLFLLLPESAPVRDLPAGSCSRKLFERVVSRVRALISGEVSHVPYVEWVSGGKPCTLQAAWPQPHSFPSSI